MAAKVLVEGLRRAGKGATRESLINGLESIQSFDIGGLMVNYGPRSHVASHFVDLTMLTAYGNVRV